MSTGGAAHTAAADGRGPPLHFAVEGMTCASCAARVERELARQPGVAEARVNFATGQASVEGAELDAAGLERAVASIGYTLSELGEPGTRAHDDAADQESDRLRRRVVGAGLLTAPVVALAMSGADFPGVRWIQALLTLPVVFGFGLGFHRSAALRLRSGGANMDSLVSMGTLAATGASLAALPSGAPVYFETAAVIVTLILLGRWLEARARGRASQAVKRLLELGAPEARVLRDGREQSVPAQSLSPGDVLVIRPGEKVPTDSVVLEGTSSLDESLVTGESLPRGRGPGDALVGATINLEGRLVARATRTGAETTLAQIVALLERTQASKAPVQRWADRVSGVFVPIVIGIAITTGLGWLAAGVGSSLALERAVAVLIIACPCALGLATPTAILVGSGRGAELGVFFKDAEVFERARSVKTVVFDKTGTLTLGRMELQAVVGSEPDRVLARAAAVEDASEHPIARAVVAGAHARNIPLTAVCDFESTPGLGVVGDVEGERVWVGREAWLLEQGLAADAALAEQARELEQAGASVFFCGWDGRLRGALGVSDSLRETSAATVAALRSRKLEVILLTGDRPAPALAIARRLGISRVLSEVLPAGKAEAILSLQRSGEQVAFVGDGVNDAPALAQADLGIALGSGSDVAIEAGHAVLVSNDPAGAVTALDLARRTFRVLAQNLAWAFAYNVAAIPLAAAGALDPMLAAGAMAGSSLSVVANSLRLRGFRPARLGSAQSEPVRSQVSAGSSG